MENLYVHDEIVHNSRAAQVILPYLFKIFKPQSILDVGCGLGNWLQVANNLGVVEVKGIDGAYINRSLLKIKDDEFQECDLRKSFSLDRMFDLLICLEVAEHLPEDSADEFIKSLTRHSNVILFSAAIPGQNGQNHVNEQWPSYWEEKFKQHDFVFKDIFRTVFWNDNRIEYWYRQNLFLVVKMGSLLEMQDSGPILPLVHPELLELTIKNYENKIERIKSRFNASRKVSFLKMTRFFKKK